MTDTTQANPLGQILVKGSGKFDPRYFKDNAARWVVWGGGLGVIAALLLIFFYLLSEVFPLFSSAHFDARPAISLPQPEDRTLYIGAEEQAEIGVRVAASGQVSFIDLHDGKTASVIRLPNGLAPQQVVDVAPERALLLAQFADGSALPFTYSFRTSYGENNARTLTAQMQYPFGEAPLAFMSEAPQSLAVREDDGKLLLAGVNATGQVQLKFYEQTESMMGDTELTVGSESSFAPAVKADLLLLEPLLSWLTVLDKTSGKMAFYKLNGGNTPELVAQYETGAPITAAHYLGGGISMVIAQANGVISQWFPARNEAGDFYLARVRDFEIPNQAKATVIGPELRRRGFAVGDDSGHVTVYYATSGKEIYHAKMVEGAVQQLAFNPRANYLMALGGDGKVAGFDVHNEHPEISFSALWGKVWYESYDESKWLWQSSSASADFEPKFSLVPLSFGTLKGAFYAMIFAVPLAVLGAIFTANFMSPEMRQLVKPTVELLAALPSVILGFLAGLWLAPFIEANLPGMFLLLILLPLSIPLFGYAWMNLPRKIKYLVPAGWEALLLVPVIAGITWLCFGMAKPIEALAFGGNMQAWMDATLGIKYDQRNALVVGIAMGIAVIPTIFSIAEDAIFSVPKQLSLGSLALGATPWQTLTGVVMPTASPGIFSAIMIGLGRAVGETMIVLMATGNTPVTDASLFSGMRTLSANVAVEMPESEVGSTHFRLLFLAGLTLFVFTFIFNTLAETVRASLRKKYASI